MPNKDSGLTLDTTKSSCNSGVTITWDDDNWHAIVDYSTYESSDSERTKCTLYFKSKPVAGKDVLTYVQNNADASSTDIYTVPNKTSDSCTYTLAYDGTSDNNLRYVGKNPCNYVTFNNENAGWRIIGILKTPEGQRLKLIRANSIGEYSWDNKDLQGFNSWPDSTLKDVLNSGAYYNRTSGTCPDESRDAVDCDFTNNGLTEEAKNQIDTITWQLGGIDDTSSKVFASHFYIHERGTTVYTGRPTEWPGKVGLMYPSDYGYATSGGTSMNRASCLEKELEEWAYSDCRNNDWRYNSSGRGQWLLSSSSSSDNESCHIGLGGIVSCDSLSIDNEMIFPSIYLKSNVTILSGEGTEENPYTIG